MTFEITSFVAEFTVVNKEVPGIVCFTFFDDIAVGSAGTESGNIGTAHIGTGDKFI